MEFLILEWESRKKDTRRRGLHVGGAAEEPNQRDIMEAAVTFLQKDVPVE